jgi:putative phosphoribosyl transferase
MRPKDQSATVHQEEVLIAVERVVVAGDLVVPSDAKGLVVFAHGSGSSRHSPRNRYVAHVLHASGVATLLLDLLTPSEGREDETTRAFRFNIDLLAARLVGATDWIRRQQRVTGLPVGYFGASTGAAAALQAAAATPASIGAIVSRGGRPDLAGEALARVRAPALLIVGGADTQVLALNERALRQLPEPKQLTIIPDATHLFEEPGALEAVARLADDWFTRYLDRSG